MVKYLDVEEFYDDSMMDEEHQDVNKNKPGGENKNNNKKIEDINPDLRLINDYFKDVANESLLTPKQELSVSAGICSCDKNGDVK